MCIFVEINVFEIASNKALQNIVDLWSNKFAVAAVFISNLCIFAILLDFYFEFS